MNAPAICFTCGSDLLATGTTPFRGSPGYSSTHDGTGELEINICDPCLTQRSGRVTQIITTQTTTTRRETWRP